MTLAWYDGILEDAIARIGNWIATVFFWLIKIIFQVMDAFMDIIFQLAGITNMGDGQNVLSRFFSSSSGGGVSNSISNLYFYMCIVCVVLMLFLTVVSIIKQDFFSEEPAKSHAPIFKRMLLGVLYFIAIPPVFIFSVNIISELMAALMRIESFAQLTSLSQAIFELSLTKPDWMTVQGVQLDPIPHWSIVSTRDFIALTNTYDFNLLIFVGVIGMSFYSLFMISFGLIKRIFNLVVLYVIGPIAISQSVLDGGNKMRVWKDSVIKEFISVFGTVIGLVIFSLFVTEVVVELNFFDVTTTTGLSRTAASLGNVIIKALFVLVGFSVIKSDYSVITNAVGANISVSSGAATFGEMKSAAKFAREPFRVAGRGVKNAANLAKGAGKFLKLANPDYRREVGEKIGKSMPTGDFFRSEAQKKKIQEERETIAQANRDYKMTPKKAPDRAEKEIIANPVVASNYIKTKENEYGKKIDKFKSSSQSKINTLESPIPVAITTKEKIKQKTKDKDGKEIEKEIEVVRDVPLSTVDKKVFQDASQSINVATTGDYDRAKYATAKTNIRTAIEAEKDAMETDIAIARTAGVSETEIVTIRKEHNTKIRELQEVEVNLEQTEVIHSGKTELTKQRAIVDKGNSRNTHHRAQAIKAATKALEIEKQVDGKK